MAPNMISLEVLAEAKQKTSWSIQIQFYVLWKAELDAFVHWLEILEYWADVKTRDCHPLTCRIFFWVREDLLKTLRFPGLPFFHPSTIPQQFFPSPRYFTPFPSPVQVFYKYIFSSTKNCHLVLHSSRRTDALPGNVAETSIAIENQEYAAAGECDDCGENVNDCKCVISHELC